MNYDLKCKICDEIIGAVVMPDGLPAPVANHICDDVTCLQTERDALEAQALADQEAFGQMLRDILGL